MNKIRQIGYLVLGTSLVFGVAACGSTGDDKDIQGGIDPGKQTEVNTELTTEQKNLSWTKPQSAPWQWLNQPTLTTLRTLPTT